MHYVIVISLLYNVNKSQESICKEVVYVLFRFVVGALEQGGMRALNLDQVRRDSSTKYCLNRTDQHEGGTN